mgnify:FL=1
MKLFGTSSFIEVYDNALSKDECDILIDQFKISPQVFGRVNIRGEDKVIPAYKKSIELEHLDLSDESVISIIIRDALLPQLIKYREKYSSLSEIAGWGVDEKYTFKKFETEEDGYHRWHCEQVPGRSDRMGVWMFYLNDAQGTEFMHYPTVKAKGGRCVIWPAAWTHAHKSAPNKGIKYIVSGWLTYI